MQFSRLIAILLPICFAAEFEDEYLISKNHKKAIIYKPRLRYENTGFSWQLWDKAYEEYCKYPSKELAIKTCSISLPVDAQQGLERTSIQNMIFKDLGHDVLLDVEDINLAADVLRMLEIRIFAYQEDFNMVLDGMTDSSKYKDPSLTALMPLYNFLSLICDANVTLAFHKVIDECELVIRLFDLLISPDSQERIAVTDIIGKIIEYHPNLRVKVLERVLEIMKLVQDSNFDHVHARSIIPVISVFDRFSSKYNKSLSLLYLGLYPDSKSRWISKMNYWHIASTLFSMVSFPSSTWSTLPNTWRHGAQPSSVPLSLSRQGNHRLWNYLQPIRSCTCLRTHS